MVISAVVVVFLALDPRLRPAIRILVTLLGPGFVAVVIYLMFASRKGRSTQ